MQGNVHANKVLAPLVDADTVEARDIIVYESQAAAVSPLLTTDRTVEEFADLVHLIQRHIVGLPPTIKDYQEPLINFYLTGGSEYEINSGDISVIQTFIIDNYTSTEASDYSAYISASPYVYQSTIVQDIQRGDYDYLIAPAKVGINTESPASALDV